MNSVKGWAAALAVVSSLAGTAPTAAQTSSAPPFVGVAPIPAPGDVFSAWLGYARTRDFSGGFGGFVYALNQRNLNAEGFILRGELYGGVYDPSVDTWGWALMFGYRVGLAGGFLTGYAGAAFETHNNTPIGATIAGSQGGAKFAIEYLIPERGSFEFYSVATYSTVFETYFAFVRPSFRVAPPFRLGPEVMFFGNSAYRDVKVGGFVGFKIDQILQRGEIVLSGGYLHPLVSGSPDGYYVNVTLSITR